MAARLRVSKPLSRRIAVIVVAVLLFGWVFLYRFNTLGGAFGGFDNDHFLLLRAGQAGRRRASSRSATSTMAMQGARPSLTYELSAAAQRYFGDNLRSEAWLTVGGVALGAAVAFLAGSVVAPWPWALATGAAVGADVAEALWLSEGRRDPRWRRCSSSAARGLPTWRRVALLSVWTAIAFLFRHDYAVYCAVGFVAVIAAVRRACGGIRLGRAGAYRRHHDGAAGAVAVVDSALSRPDRVRAQRSAR